MQYNQDPDFLKAVAKQSIVKELLMAMSALQTAGGRLDVIDHEGCMEAGCMQLLEYGAGIERLIVEVSQL